MAAAMIPALGRDFADSPLFDFAADLARSQAALLRDDPARVAPPDYDVRPAFGSLNSILSVLLDRLDEARESLDAMVQPS